MMSGVSYSSHPWMYQIAMHSVGDDRSARRCLQIATQYADGLWGVKKQSGEAVGLGPLAWLNGGRDPSTDYPTWSRFHVALYTSAQVASIMFIIQDVWPEAVSKRLFG